tara:strand:+ start:120 stop:614 length:495 start_codon:yes stop_codon:yes gene_type:complete
MRWAESCLLPYCLPDFSNAISIIVQTTLSECFSNSTASPQFDSFLQDLDDGDRAENDQSFVRAELESINLVLHAAPYLSREKRESVVGMSPVIVIFKESPTSLNFDLHSISPYTSIVFVVEPWKEGNGDGHHYRVAAISRNGGTTSGSEWPANTFRLACLIIWL